MPKPDNPVRTWPASGTGGSPLNRDGPTSPPTLTGGVVRRMSMGAVSPKAVGTEVGVECRGSLLKEATGEGTGRKITMPRGFDHRSPPAYSTGNRKRDLI